MKIIDKNEKSFRSSKVGWTRQVNPPNLSKNGGAGWVT